MVLVIDSGRPWFISSPYFRVVQQLADLSKLYHLFRGDRAQVLDWMRLYLEESPTYFDQLSESLVTGDAEAMANAAHDLCPQAHYLGAPRMLELLECVEAKVKDEGTAACAELIPALQSVSEAINAQLREALGTG